MASLDGTPRAKKFMSNNIGLLKSPFHTVECLELEIIRQGILGYAVIATYRQKSTIQ
jgi:hypothetical protein